MILPQLDSFTGETCDVVPRAEWPLTANQSSRVTCRATDQGTGDVIFDHVLSKPGYVLDDKGWTWVKFTRVIKSADDV